MIYKNTIFTKQLNIIEYKACFNEVVAVLKNNDLLEVEMLFGFAWANEYKNWIPFTVSLEEIADEIGKAEASATGTFYEDDTFLYLNAAEIEVLFCHEHDMHLSYNEANKIINEIANAWEAKQIIHQRRNNPK